MCVSLKNLILVDSNISYKVSIDFFRNHQDFKEITVLIIYLI